MNAPLSIPSPAACPKTIDELLQLIRRGHAKVPASLMSFGADEPGEDMRAYPWVKTDANRNPIGTFTYSATAGKWLRDWSCPVGTLRTVYSSAVSVSADREDKGLVDGWELADGTGVSSLDLTSQQGFFQGSAPAWDVYTIMFVGYGV